VNGLPRSTDVFVIGGGPAGLASAIAARRAGMDVTVADCARPAIDKACGEGIMPDGVAAATALGIRLQDASPYPFQGIRFSEGGLTASAKFPDGCGLGLRRTALHSLMTERAAEAGVRLVWGTRITGLTAEGVLADGCEVRARWTVGADGGNSVVRRWAGLEASAREGRRYAFRRHYEIAPWSEFMEIHWADGCQLYVTPVAPREVCVVLIGRSPSVRLDDALPLFPDVARRLAEARIASVERGGISATRHLKRIYSGRVVLVGDASAAVDAITGEGLCLLFQQSISLARGLASGDLAEYEKEHRRLLRRPSFMADLMLTLDRRRGLRHRVMRAMNADPSLFQQMLAMHVGELSGWSFAATGLRLGRQMLAL
jgi:flavin-dependent dehydrogenase